MVEEEWGVVVFQCNCDEIQDVLVSLYDFAIDLQGVIDVHFLIRDRVGDDVVVSFRFLAEQRHIKAVKSKIRYKLNQLVTKGNFSINPKTEPFDRYVTWTPKERIDKTGVETFQVFCDSLSRLSRLVVDLARKNYFSWGERVELAHVMSRMLGCTEYGLLSTTGMQVGYYDRLIDKCHPYLNTSFPQEAKKHTL